PESVRRFWSEEPTVWQNYNQGTRSAYDRGRGNESPLTRPGEILASYVWLLHFLAFENPGGSMVPLCGRITTGYHDILQRFVSTMDRLPCPDCQFPIMQRVERRYPKLLLEKLDILLLVPRILACQLVCKDPPELRGIALEGLIASDLSLYGGGR
ncbi:hypothetical protein F4677DRAFT_238703, partial [Hypoxylon crocopeplum]